MIKITLGPPPHYENLLFGYKDESGHQLKNPENVCLVDFDNTFADKIYPERGLKNPEFRENPENCHLCG